MNDTHYFILSDLKYIMDIELYLLIQLIISVITLFIGIRLIVGITPEGLRGSEHLKSRKIMGIAFSISPIIYLIYYFTDLRYLNFHYALALNLIGYYPTAALINISLLILAGEKINFKSKFFKIYVSSFIIYPIYVIVGVTYYNADSTLSSANTLLFASIAAQFVYYHFIHRNLKDESDEIMIHRKWIRKMVSMLISLAVIACIASTCLPFPYWLRLIFTTYVLAIYIHIYESYFKFILAYHIRHTQKINANRTITESATNSDTATVTTQPTISPDIAEHLSVELGKWLNDKGYCTSGVNIESLAEELHTNRTYLSSYINSTYGCSFKSWVTKLRLEYAKTLLIDPEHEYTMNQIAEKAGFASQSSFIHVFRKTNEVTPTKWKEENRPQD